MKHKIEVYKDDAGEWRWRMMSGNGRIVAESGEGYKERRKALRPLYDLLGLPEPRRTKDDTYWVADVRLTVRNGKNGHPERVVWEFYRGGFVHRTISLDVIA
jgi:uncharacterized protein YegP (UPF0339 family)